MQKSSSIIAPAVVVGLFALLLSSACSPPMGGRAGVIGGAVAGVPQPRDTANHQGRQAAPPPAADWTPAMPLTGRALKCEHGRIKTFACANVELLSYLPKSALGESSGYDVWG